MDPGIEGVELPGEGGKAEGRDHIGELCGPHGVIEVQSADACHGAGAVCDAEPLFADQRVQLFDAGAAQRLIPGEKLALVVGLPQAQQHQPHVTQRGQVAGGAERALLGDPGGDALVQKLCQTLHQQGTYAAYAHAESVGPEQHHAADDLFGIGFAGADAVT